MLPKSLRVFALPLLLSAVGPVQGAGNHNGEADKIEAKVAFHNASGRTTTNGSGITYAVPQWGWSLTENKVYPQEYWGTFPLYFVGQTMGFSVTVTNKTTKGKKNFKIRVKALNNVLETDGSAGMSLADPQEWEISSLAPGESKTLNGTVYIKPDPNLPSGLDLTRVRVYHLNSGSEEAALIREDIAVWCPPDVPAPWL